MTPTGRSAGARRDTLWYDLFSRGARDWLRHNQKIRDAVRQRLPELISQANVSGDDGRRVRVPVRMLEHYRFRLASGRPTTGTGQGRVEPGDELAPARRRGEPRGKAAGGSEQGGIELVLELAVDDIVDWLWEELELPNLEMKGGALEHEAYTREGWNRRGPRARLDRRRSLKESIKRRAARPEGPAFTDDDLRYRQLVRRENPSFQAVVFFVMDVSASMSVRDRQLAKTFFFWVVQGLRRQYAHLDTVFVAHTDRAWEFEEKEFFEVKGSGGTIASAAFSTVLERMDADFDPGRYNVYAFYASDGQNFPEDREPALETLSSLGRLSSFLGFVEIAESLGPPHQSEMAHLFEEVRGAGAAVGVYAVQNDSDVWNAIRAFFREQAEEHA